MGALAALAVVKPLGRGEFLTRLSVSEIGGFIAEPGLRHWWDWPAYPRLILLASFLCALAAWFVIGAGIRILKGMDKLPKS